MKKKSIPSLPSFPADGAVDRERIHRMMVTTDFCLRGIEPKQSVLAETPLCTGWMIFLNRGCTLAHIMHADDAAEGTYIRMKIPHTLQGSHPEYLRRWFYHRMKNRYII